MRKGRSLSIILPTTNTLSQQSGIDTVIDIEDVDECHNPLVPGEIETLERLYVCKRPQLRDLRQKIRKTHVALKNVRQADISLVRNIVAAWKCIKAVRAKSGYVSTTVKLQLHKLEWIRDLQFDPNHPVNTELTELIRACEQRDRATGHFRLHALEEEFDFTTKEQLEKSSRFGLLQLWSSHAVDDYSASPSLSLLDEDPITTQRARSIHYIQKVLNLARKKTVEHQEEIQVI
ncbi:hypothetical protein J4Q44_G00008410 [Coregonus suidteri]|uniref:Uncharacterized protein n=1 Tax=Coregonus suidteri TaxID=861788 RepID=A0AAN8R980_9TELE